MSDGLGTNKILGAALAACLGALGLGVAADGLYATHYPEKPGLAVDVPDAPAGGGPAAAPKPVDWGVVLADQANLPALIAKGEALHKACLTCHNFDPGGPNGQGPNLYGVVGRMSGSHPGFAYSDGMKAHAKPWSYDELAHFIGGPAAYVPGTKMSFAGYRRQEDQVAVIAYLRTLAPSPAPLPAPLPPEPAAAPAADAAATPAPAEEKK